MSFQEIVATGAEGDSVEQSAHREGQPESGDHRADSDPGDVDGRLPSDPPCLYHVRGRQRGHRPTALGGAAIGTGSRAALAVALDNMPVAAAA